MTRIAFDAASSAALSPLAMAAPAEPKTARATLLREGWGILASLKLTVVLLVLGIFLVWAGTLAQIDRGIWTVVDQYFRTPIAWIDLHVFVQFGQIFFGVPQSWRLAGSVPFPGGWLIGGLMLVNLLAAHALRFRLSWKRSGIFLIHGGMIAMLVGELMTGLLAVEWNMTIPEGGSSNYVENIRRIELAITDRSDSHQEEVVVIPEPILRRGGVIQHPELPFDIMVEQYMVNSELASGFTSASKIAERLLPPERFSRDMADRLATVLAGTITRAIDARKGLDETVRAVADSLPHSKEFDIEQVAREVLSPLVPAIWENNRATAGAGKKSLAIERPEVSGAASDQKVDAPSVYVILKRKGSDKTVGAYLASLWLREQDIELDGQQYDLSLRFERTYKPYSLHLNKFRHDTYVGTDTPKDFSSFVRLLEPANDVDRSVRIYMNHPLYYSGETFYQAEFRKDETGTSTILQVVNNPGWAMPYVSCVLVALGMLVHFGLHLVGFLRRGSPAGQTARPAEGAGVDSLAGRSPRPRSGGRASAATPPAVLDRRGMLARGLPWITVALATVYLAAQTRPGSSERMKLDEMGRLPAVYKGREKPLDTLARNALMIVSDRQTFVDADGKRQPAIRWLLDVMSGNGRGEEHKVFRIENEQVLDVLGLEPRSGWRYAINEFKDKMPVIEKEATRANKLDPKNQEVFDAKMIELGRQLQFYIQLAQLEAPHLVPPLVDGEDWTPLVRTEDLARRAAVTRVREAIDRQGVPPESMDQQQIVARWQEEYRTVLPHLEAQRQPAERHLDKLLATYKEGDAKSFNQELAAYQLLLEGKLPDVVQKAGFEVFFNRVAPFYHSSILYVLIGLLTAVGWLGWRAPWHRSAFALLLLTLVVHSFALGTRMYLQGRPPVTNLYSSAIFIGWGCVLLAMVLEAIFRNGIGTFVAAVTGFLTLLVAHNLSGDGDTLEMMQAVLDTNFWLATHVTCITIGYAATFLAGFLALLYVLMGLLTRSLDKEMSKTLSRMIYGILCFATLTSFTGTVLGGIWADQSWGRFWGWDPKENGALLIVLWNVLTLHARWDGLVRQRGLAVLAIAGNMITAWSWFGTNQLGVGLHAYGFNNQLAMWLTIFWASQVLLLGLGLLPQQMWRSRPMRSDLAAPAPTGALA